MPLAGNLRDFALHDFLYVVARGSKTGSLSLRRAEGGATLYFHEGKLISVVRPEPHEPIGEMLIRLGKLERAPLERALQRQAVDGVRPIGKLLVEQAAIGERELQAAVQTVIEQTVYELLGWREGEFEWRGDGRPGVGEVETPVPVPVEALIMEGVRRVDELARIRERIPRDDLPLLRGAGLPAEPSNLTPEERRVLDRVDDRRGVAAIAAELGLDLFEARSAAFNLVVYGLAVVEAP